MSKREDAWSGKWCKEKLETHDAIDSIELISENFLKITDLKGCSFMVATMNLKKIDSVDLETLLAKTDVDFVLNISSEPYITQSALGMITIKKFGIGGMGDIKAALRDGNIKNYISKEIKFILNGLRQHTKVINVTRLDNRRFKVERQNHLPVTIVALHEYELTAERVRNAKDIFTDFDIILISDPSGTPSSNAESVALTLGIKIFKWGELLGMLNKP